MEGITHRRYNPLTGEWVLVSPNRTKRPWQGKNEDSPTSERPTYDFDCYLCPGNKRAGGEYNPPYEDVYVFDNDYPSLQYDVGRVEDETGSLLQAKQERGKCRVVCFSPRHDLTMAQLSVSAIEKVIEVWTQEYLSLSAFEHINYVQIFENKGEIMGCSNPHPHGQIWATESIPNEPLKETKMQGQYFEEHESTLLADYVKLELEQEKRVVMAHGGFVVVVPYWAIWPFETMIVSKRPIAHLGEMNSQEKTDLAQCLHELTRTYDALFNVSFPYSAGIHQSPSDGKPHPEWHLHMHFYPPLLRSATVKKFMVGFEMLGYPQRDITPEMSAERLRHVYQGL